jgi:hypothetical protein
MSPKNSPNMPMGSQGVTLLQQDKDGHSNGTNSNASDDSGTGDDNNGSTNLNGSTQANGGNPNGNNTKKRGSFPGQFPRSVEQQKSFDEMVKNLTSLNQRMVATGNPRGRGMSSARTQGGLEMPNHNGRGNGSVRARRRVLGRTNSRTGDMEKLKAPPMAPAPSPTQGLFPTEKVKKDFWLLWLGVGIIATLNSLKVSTVRRVLQC